MTKRTSKVGENGKVLTTHFFSEDSLRQRQMKAESPASKTKIVFIVSATGRSGTTLLARLLGELEACVNIGEASRLISGQIPDDLCGCGKPMDSCPFWNHMEKATPEPVQKFLRRWTRTRFLPLHLLLSRWRPLSRRRHQFLQTMEGVYGEIARRSASTVIVECVNGPAYLNLLTHLLTAESYVVHLVRDPREVAMSWSKRKGSLPVYSGVGVCLRWLIHNVLFEWVGRQARSYRRLRFEDFVEKPRETLELITGGILEKPRLPLDSQGRAHLHPQHHVAGNPDKLLSGDVVIRPQTASRIPLRVRLLALLVTFPLLSRYGYL